MIIISQLTILFLMNVEEELCVHVISRRVDWHRVEKKAQTA